MSEVSINDSILTNCLNLSESGLYFCASYNTLRWVCEYTGQKIDTVVCCVGLPSFAVYTHYDKDKVDPSWIHRTERYSLIDYLGFLQDFLFRKGGIETVCEHLTYEDWLIDRIGGKYNSIDRQKANEDNFGYKLKSRFGNDGFTEQVLRRESPLQVKYLRKIRNYCQEKDIVFIIYNSPTYHLNHYISDIGYRNFLLHEFGPDQLIADYSDFKIPRSDYYGDLLHLNSRGANYFCNYIKKNGWCVTTAKEYYSLCHKK